MCTDESNRNKLEASRSEDVKGFLGDEWYADYSGEGGSSNAVKRRSIFFANEDEIEKKGREQMNLVNLVSYCVWG